MTADYPDDTPVPTVRVLASLHVDGAGHPHSRQLHRELTILVPRSARIARPSAESAAEQLLAELRAPLVEAILAGYFAENSRPAGQFQGD